MTKKKNFRQQWRSLTEIGNTFGISARKLGLLLKKHGLREDNGEEKTGVSSKEATLNTEARKLARSYIEAVKLDEEGNKFGYWMFDELRPEIKKVGLNRFNKALKAVGFKGEQLTEEAL
jgi:Asp-tRNA(Asn)/Glu-tRNA(Gln) amidotransferase B subunit